MNEAELIFFGVKVWLSIGALVAVAFLFLGIDRIDEDADGAYVFRPLLVPGVLLIWPLVVWRWFILESGRDSWPKRHLPIRDAHFWVSIIFGAAIVLIIITGFSIRQVWPTAFEPQKLALVERLVG